MSEQQVSKQELKEKWFKIGYEDGKNDTWTPPYEGPGTTTFDAWEDGFAKGGEDRADTRTAEELEQELREKWFKIGYEDKKSGRWPPPDGIPGTTAYDAWKDGYSKAGEDIAAARTPRAIEKQTIPAGRYFIGDPAYAEGQPTFSTHTHHGDGIYSDKDGTHYPVDSGQLAAIPLPSERPSEWGLSFSFPDPLKYGYEDGKDYPIKSGIPGAIRRQPARPMEWGLIVTFPEPAACWYEDGIIHFGHIQIDTRDEETRNQHRQHRRRLPRRGTKQ